MDSITPGTGDDAAIVEAAAKVLIGTIDADDAAAQVNVTVQELIGFSSDPRTIRRFYDLRDAGGIASAKAVNALEAAVAHISSLIEANKLPPTSLIKATEVLHKVSGIEDKRKEQCKAKEDKGTGARVIINLIGQEPLVIKANEGPLSEDERPCIDAPFSIDEGVDHEPR